MTDPRREGLLLIDKPEGPTSHDMVKEVRRLFGGARVGHTGTLDPMATGLLVILAGRATKLAPYVKGDPKVYSGSILLGRETDSLDRYGTVVRERGFGGSGEEVGDAMASLVGELEQVPPVFSAVKLRGRRAYLYARRGEAVELPSRRVRVYRMEMTGFRRARNTAEADFLLECSPGTYVRELAARLGEILSCGGVLSRLRREASGPFRVEDAFSLEEFRRLHAEGEPLLHPMHKALEGMARIEVEASWVKAVVSGCVMKENMLAKASGHLEPGDRVAVMGGGTLLAVHEVLRASPYCSRPLRVVGA